VVVTMIPMCVLPPVKKKIFISKILPWHFDNISSHVAASQAREVDIYDGLMDITTTTINSNAKKLPWISCITLLEGMAFSLQWCATIIVGFVLRMVSYRSHDWLEPCMMDIWLVQCVTAWDLKHFAVCERMTSAVSKRWQWSTCTTGPQIGCPSSICRSHVEELQWIFHKDGIWFVSKYLVRNQQLVVGIIMSLLRPFTLVLLKSMNAMLSMQHCSLYFHYTASSFIWMSFRLPHVTTIQYRNHYHQKLKPSFSKKSFISDCHDLQSCQVGLYLLLDHPCPPIQSKLMSLTLIEAVTLLACNLH